MTWLKMTSTYPQRLGHPLSARNEKRAIKKIKSISAGITTATNRERVISWKQFQHNSSHEGQ